MTGYFFPAILPSHPVHLFRSKGYEFFFFLLLLCKFMPPWFSISTISEFHNHARAFNCSCFSGGPHTPVNMVDNMEEVNVGGIKRRKWHICWAVNCVIYRVPSFCKSLKFFWTSIASLDQETVQLTAFSILTAMFTGSVWPAREAKPRFAATLVCSAHDCETRLLCYLCQGFFLPLC